MYGPHKMTVEQSTAKGKSSTAQFLSVDFIAPITRAPYTYTEDNPLNGSDPTGLFSAPIPQVSLARLNMN